MTMSNLCKKKNEFEYMEMAEKGRNGFSFLIQVGRPSLKSVSSYDGKDSSAKPKKEAFVKIDNYLKHKSLILNIEQELSKNVKCQCLMDCEAAQQMVVLSADPSIKILISFDKGFQYAKKYTRYSNLQNVKNFFEMLKKHGISDNEICVIANICPETADEVFALVPSLKGKRSKLQEPVKYVLTELAKLNESP